MSYLDFPSFSLVGNFYTDPSTMDNDPSHYDESCTNPSPWQDPGGSHFFSFQDILASQPNRAFTPPVVTCAFDQNGNPSLTDPLINAPVSSTDTPGATSGQTPPFSPAKMVDLDVYQQGVSNIYGFVLKLTVGGTVLSGAMDTCTLNSIRFDRVLPTRGWAGWDSYGWGSFGGDSNACGVYQSVLRIPATSWPAASGSPILDQLRAAATQDTAGNLLLSIRMTLDGYQNVPWHASDFRIGRVLATIGPQLATDPSHCIDGRWLAGRSAGSGDVWNQPSLYGAPFEVKNNIVAIDLSNALMTSAPGQGPIDLGNLSLYIGDGSTGVVGTPFQTNDILYSLSGGIVRLPLTAAQATAAASAPFFLTSSRPGINGLSTFNKEAVLWQESPTGFWIACDDRNVQLASDQPNPGSQLAHYYVTQWGQPVTDASLVEHHVFSCFPNNSAATVPWPAGYKGNSLSSEGCLEAVLCPGAQPGQFCLELSAIWDPGSRTPELESQLYFICLWQKGTAPPPPNLETGCPPQEQMISAVVWSSYPVNTTPEWAEIQRLMKVYVKLFPSMHARMDLSDQQTFQIFSTNPPWFVSYANMPGPSQYTLPSGGVIASGTIPYYMTRTIDDPRLMPIMRDLSPNRLLTVLYYCYNLQQETQPTPPPPGEGGAHATGRGARA